MHLNKGACPTNEWLRIFDGNNLLPSFAFQVFQFRMQ